MSCEGRALYCLYTWPCTAWRGARCSDLNACALCCVYWGCLCIMDVYGHGEWLTIVWRNRLQQHHSHNMQQNKQAIYSGKCIMRHANRQLHWREVRNRPQERTQKLKQTNKQTERTASQHHKTGPHTKANLSMCNRDVCEQSVMCVMCVTSVLPEYKFSTRWVHISSQPSKVLCEDRVRSCARRVAQA